MATSIHSLKEELECPICLETLQDPRTLDCQHSFCRRCLQAMVRSRDRITCPECRHDTLLPDDRDVANFPKPILLNKLCERIRHCLDGNAEGIEIYCEMCKKADLAANVVCKECSKSLCASCEKKHRSAPLFAAHKVIPLSDNTVCRTHRGELIKFYCTTCKTGICVVCATGQHSQHALREVEELGEERKAELDEWAEKFVEVADMHEAQINELVTRELNLDTKFVEVERQVERWYDEAIALLQQNKLASDANIKHKHKSEMQKWHSYLAKLEETHNSQKSLYNLIQSVIKSGSGAEIVACAADLSDVVPSSEIIKQPALATPVFCPPDVEDILSKCLIVYEVENMLNLQQADIGKSTIPIFPLIRDTTTPSLSCSLPPEMDTFVPSLSRGTSLEGSHMYKSIEVEAGGYVRDVVWDRETNWFFLKGPTSTTVYNPLGDEMHTIEHNGWEGRGLCMDTKRNCLVTTEAAFNKIKQWRKTGEPVGDLSTSGFLQGIFKFSPEYMTYCWQHDNYILTDYSKGKVAIFDCELKNTVFKFEGEAPKMIRPRYLTCDCKCPSQKGLIAVSDKGDHSVKVYDREGTCREVFGSYGMEEGQLSSPSGVCYDQMGRLLVCDTRNKRVVRFTSSSSCSTDGPYWECVLDANDLEQQYPKALDLMSDNRLALVTYERNAKGNKHNHKLNIYGGYV